MATLLLTQRSDASYIRPHRILLRERIWVLLRSWHLDYALAHGAVPSPLRAYTPADWPEVPPGAGP